MNVLLVEDDSKTEYLIDFALSEIQQNNYLTIVHDGQEAIDVIKKYQQKLMTPELKLVILDLKLPKLNGIEVLKEIRKHSVTQFVPVVIFTSSEDPNVINQCYQAGANSYIVKPFDFDEFTECIQCLYRFWVKLNQTMTE